MKTIGEVVGGPDRGVQRVDEPAVASVVGRDRRSPSHTVIEREPRQRVDEAPRSPATERRRDRREVGEVVAAAERRATTTRCSTPAVRSWAASSGGRSSVLSGTTVRADAAERRARRTGHAVPFGMSTPDPGALADAAARSGGQRRGVAGRARRT